MDVNQAFVNITGLSREQLIGDYFNHHFTNQEEAQKGVSITFRDGQVKNFDLDLKTSNDETIPVSFNASVFFNHENIVQGIFAVARDIRDNRRIMKQLEESKNYARGLIESSIDLMVTVNCQGVVTDVNDAAVKLTGYLREKLINSNFQNYFTDPQKANQGIDITFKEGKVKDYELELINSKLVKIPVSFNASVYKNSEGTVMGVFAIARDMR
jgi:PAS domain S-box-containing protein